MRSLRLIGAVRRRLGVAILVITALVASAVGSSTAWATPGPALEVPQSELAAALTCSAGLATATKPVVLISDGTFGSGVMYRSNYGTLLPALGHPVCTINKQPRSVDDIQILAEFVVNAVRTINAISHQKVLLVGVSQGSVDTLWALKFWPDLPAKVLGYVSISGLPNGTDRDGLGRLPECELPGNCWPAEWQAINPAHGKSNFITALQARPLPAGPGYTTLSSRLDVLATPQPAASYLPGATNILAESQCPGLITEHATLVVHGLTYAVVLDALTHNGTVDPGRIPAAVCSQTFMPGMNLLQFLVDAGTDLTVGVAVAALFRRVSVEPPVRCYANPDC